jgi:outer membrane protein OmpA-like peptidoglycan-associated protein
MRLRLFSGLLLAGTLFAQAPSPVQTGVPATASDGTPIFRVDVTSRTIRAVNYHHRQATTKIDFRGTALMPEARGDAEVTANNGASRVNLHFNRLSNPAQYGPEYLTLVLWAITPEGRAERLGEVTLKDANDRSAQLYATTDLQTFGMIVTAEPYFSVSQPSDVVVMENFQREDTIGTMEVIDAKYELLKRGQYVLNIHADRLQAVTADLRVPLQLREAREAIAIAVAQGANTYAGDTMKKANIGLTNAEGFNHSKNWKELDTNAREATQMAEDARRITIQKLADLAKQTLISDEAASREKAQREATLRNQAEADAAAADRRRSEAEVAMVNAQRAQSDAEAARMAAAKEKAAADEARAEAEKLRAQAEQSRSKAEGDAQALRARLLEQFNLILATRDSARGLIVNMSDVLFDVNEATLKPGAREKLAKVSGILLAYPTLHLSVEGHTDSTGTDEYNMKLSERRADAVQTYLVTNGIPPTNVDAKGFGKASPVATNDTAVGRQQNRRVEMVVSGEIIGQPITAPSPNSDSR